MSSNGQNELSRRVAGWIDDLAGHAEAADAIAVLGDAAIPALRDDLARGPQAVPHARCFAVAMLARLHAEAATSTLRDVLHAHPLTTLAPPFAESEYVVKSDALDALAVRAYIELADDVAFGVCERLRVAVVAAGRLRLAELADALVDLLDDDVLANDAMTSLAALGQATADAIASRLDAWLTEGEFSARSRLALIRALRVLHGVSFPEIDALRRALHDPHPAVCAAAALLAWPQRRDAAIVEALLHGALGFDRELADDCRAALDDAGSAVRVIVEEALQRNAEPDLYGQLHPLSLGQRDWLTALLGRTEASRR